MTNTEPVHIIGGGLAGCEAAWQISRAGFPVTLHEMRPVRGTDAHVTGDLAELVCSNSFRSDDYEHNAVGLLHEEMRRAGSLIIQSADAHKVPAGGALAVDRVGFSQAITQTMADEPLITIIREEVTDIPTTIWQKTIISTGPLTSPALAQVIGDLTGEHALAFFDAIAPIIYKDSIDFSKAWFQSRYDKIGPGGDGKDYINCPMDEDQYTAFLAALADAPKTEFKDWEKNTPYFEGCLPIEVMAERGAETLRFGPLKPVGLTNPHNPTVKAHAIVQLRQDNALGTLYNMVGFQTKLRHGAQSDVIRLIPGLEAAEFARLGGIHRNSFINAPSLLGPALTLDAAPSIRFAGQITGCEGYVESAAIGLLAGRFTRSEKAGNTPSLPPDETAMGALLAHITGGANAKTYQPMNINFGLFPPIEGTFKGKRAARKQAKAKIMSDRALSAFGNWVQNP